MTNLHQNRTPNLLDIRSLSQWKPVVLMRITLWNFVHKVPRAIYVREIMHAFDFNIENSSAWPYLKR